MTKAVSRVERRRELTRERVLACAAEQFANNGLAATTLDEIGEAADVAKGTLYSHFASKEELALAVVKPVLEAFAEAARRFVSLPPRAAVDALLDSYLEIDRAHPHALSVAYRMQELMHTDLGKLHHAFGRAVLDVLTKAHAEGLLRTADPSLAARTLGRVGVPLLELYRGREPELFRSAVRALLLREASERTTERTERARQRTNERTERRKR